MDLAGIKCPFASVMRATVATQVSRGNHDRSFSRSHLQFGLSGEPRKHHRAVFRRRLSEPPGTLADRFRRRRPGRYCGAHHEPVAVGPIWPAIHRGEPHRLRRQYRSRRGNQFAPDGYTLLFVAPNNAISTSLYKKLPYDFIRDTVPVASIMQLTNMLVVSNAMPVKTVQEFIDYCKANPGKVSYASSGNGTSVHMSAELFKAMTKIDMVHVPYRGSALAFPDIISDKVQLIFDNLPSALEQARGGSVRALGVTSPQRWPGVPDIPTIAETVPGFESVGFYGISAPKGTPREIVEILNKAVGEALKDPRLVARLAEIGGIPKPMTPAEFGKLVTDETEKWRKVVEFSGVSVD
jgi:tripartite-type tricarboxylate transporter receptor subunit TctC